MNSRLLGLGALALSVVGACAREGGGQEIMTVEGTMQSYEEFLASLPRDTKTGAYYVDDLHVHDESVLRAEYQRRSGDSALIQEDYILNSTGYGSRVPDANQTNITYCVSNEFTLNERTIIRAQLNQASANWEDRNVSVNFVDKTSSAGCALGDTSVWYDVRKKPTCTDNSCSWAYMSYPHYPRVYRYLQLESGLYKDANQDGSPDNGGFSALMTHELGHALGFQHEHIVNGCAEGDTSFTQLTSYDVNSVMHYPRKCGSWNLSYSMSDLDVHGAQCIYNEPNSTCSVWDSGQGAEAVLSNGYVYRLNVARTALYRRSTSSAGHVWNQVTTGNFQSILGSPSALFGLAPAPNNTLYRYIDSNNTWQKVSDTAARYVASQDGQLFRLSSDKNTISKWRSGEAWDVIATGATTDIIAGYNTVFSMRSDGIRRWTSGTSWTLISAPAAAVSQDSSGRVYKLATDMSAVYELSGSTWTKIRGPSGALIGNGETAYATDPVTGFLYRYDRSTATPVWKKYASHSIRSMIGDYPFVGTLLIDSEHGHMYSYFSR